MQAFDGHGIRGAIGNLKDGLILIQQRRLHVEDGFGSDDPFHVFPDDDGGTDVIGASGEKDGFGSGINGGLNPGRVAGFRRYPCGGIAPWRFGRLLDGQIEGGWGSCEEGDWFEGAMFCDIGSGKV